MSDSVPGIEVVLQTLRELSDNNRRAMESISSIHTASVGTKATHDQQLAGIAIEQARQSARLDALEVRLRLMENGHEASKVIPVADLSSKITALSNKHEGLYGRFAAIAAIAGALAAALVSAILKAWISQP